MNMANNTWQRFKKKLKKRANSPKSSTKNTSIFGCLSSTAPSEHKQCNIEPANQDLDAVSLCKSHSQSVSMTHRDTVCTDDDRIVVQFLPESSNSKSRNPIYSVDTLTVHTITPTVSRSVVSFDECDGDITPLQTENKTEIQDIYDCYHDESNFESNFESNSDLDLENAILQEMWNNEVQVCTKQQILGVLKALIFVKQRIAEKEKERLVADKAKKQKKKSKERKKRKRVSYTKSQSPLITPKPNTETYLNGNLFHNRYKLGDKINEGGFGRVFKLENANDLNSRSYSQCVKVMNLTKDPSTQSKKRKSVIREFQMTKKAFNDESVEVELYIDSTNEPRAYLIMPFFDGKDLFEFIDDENYAKKVSVKMILQIFHKMCDEIYNLHYYKKMVHGDLKPENVMILQSENFNDLSSLEVELIDYGIAKSIRSLKKSEQYLRSKGHFGTKGYVAPELMRDSRYNRKIDVFSAGVVLFNMVTECCLFPKALKYYNMNENDYYIYLRKKFKVIKNRKKIINILYSTLAFDPEQRLSISQILERYF